MTITAEGRTLRALTEDQVTRFVVNGFLVVEDLLSPGEVEAVSGRADLIAAGEAEHVSGGVQLERIYREGEAEVGDRVLAVRKLHQVAVQDDVMWGHATNPKIVDIIADLLGTDDIKLYGDQLFMKPPEVGAEQPWHQDSASWHDIFPMDLVSSWTAIDEADHANGCLEFVPGTHRWGMMQRPRLRTFHEDFGREPWTPVAVPLRPGSVSFHHSLTVHRSGANTSGRRRRGYAVHYMRATSWKDESVTSAPKQPPFRQVRGRSYPGRV